MARKVETRVRLEGELVVRTALHVGGLGGDTDVDLALAVNGSGKHYIPGTSLAGVLRSWFEHIDRDGTDRFWGPRMSRDRPDDGHASLVIVEDAPIDSRVETEIRNGVGIDRETGAAAMGIKYDRSVLPRGTRIPLKVTIDFTDEADWESAAGSWSALLKALQRGQVRLGAGKTRGLGRVHLESPSLKVQKLSTRAGMLAALDNGGEVVSLESLRHPTAYPARPSLTFTIYWRPLGPLMVKSGTDGLAVDMLPLVSADGRDAVRFCLPGSSVKGALRSWCERLVCTLLGLREVEERDPKRRFLPQVDRPLVNQLFGAAYTHRAAGVLSVDDCYSTNQIAANQWNTIETAASDSTLLDALDESGLGRKLQQGYHVAIDRWTGGAADSMLFTVLEPHNLQWEPLRLDLNLARLDTSLQLPTVALLLLMLRDLGNNRIPLGFATLRGMGAVAVDRVEVEGGDLPAELAGLQAATLSAGDFAHLDRQSLTTLQTAWREWINQQTGEAS
jgi:CRISPR/Cas system CSM-associated protein Csm3 (group 7 of RAMP superfamily)